MKKGTILLTALLTALAMSVPTSANTEIDTIKPVKVRCTCYTSTEGSITASGEHVREGIVAVRSISRLTRPESYMRPSVRFHSLLSRSARTRPLSLTRF